MSPFEEWAITPLAAGPNGGGRRLSAPANNRLATSAKATRARTAIGRHGMRAATTGRRAISSIGSHLSGKDQAARWLVWAVCQKRSSK
jgi:hypothetical protein